MTSELINTLHSEDFFLQVVVVDYDHCELHDLIIIFR